MSDAYLVPEGDPPVKLRDRMEESFGRLGGNNAANENGSMLARTSERLVIFISVLSNFDELTMYAVVDQC